ncbi:MAG: type II toxin-antitoxin system RelE/ParE family toxin [Polyangiaceae bacterium]
MRIRARAKQDVLDAAVWYEQRKPDLGIQFVLEVDAAVSLILDNPLQFPIYDEPARRALLSRFPYAVYYQPAPLVILRVLHLRRYPDTWKSG